MKILITSLFIVFSVFTVFSQTPQPAATPVSATLSEAQKTSIEVVKLFRDKKYAEALPLAQKAVELREGEVGKKSPLVAQALRNLGYIYLNLDKTKEAKGAFERAFDIYESNQPLSVDDEKMYVELLEGVAVYRAFDGNLNRAEKQLLHAVELREKLNGKDSVEMANTLVKLSELYQALGNYEQAQPPLRRAFDIKYNNPKLRDQAYDVFSELSCTLTKLGRKSDADSLEEQFYPRSKNKPDDTDDIDGGVVNGKALNLIKPVYPAEAREKNISGIVNVAVTINEKGDVIHACAVDGAKELQRVCELAAYKSKFSPTLLGGKAVKVTGTIVYKFTRA